MKPNEDRGLKETEYLLRSPKNAERLREAVRELDQGKGTRDTVENLRRPLVLGPKAK